MYEEMERTSDQKVFKSGRPSEPSRSARSGERKRNLTTTGHVSPPQGDCSPQRTPAT